jgi:hypothetical protein
MNLAVLYPDKWLKPEQSVSLWVPLLFLFHLFCFVAPGLPLARFFVRRRWLAPALTVPAAIIISCTLGYLVFWTFFLSSLLGRLAAVAAMTPALFLLFPRRPGTGWTSVVQSAHERTPLALMAVVGLFYVTTQYVFDVRDYPPRSQLRLRFTDRHLSIDCDFPMLFARTLFDDDDPRPLLCRWLSSDRPPLQAGVCLMQSWSWGAEPYSLSWLHCQLIGCAMQTAWIPAVWALCRLLRLPRRRCGVVILLLTFTGFALINTIYCWPKMIAGALVLFALEALLFVGRGESRLAAGLLAGVAGGLGLLAHGGAFFTLLPLAFWALTPRLFPGWRAALGGAAAGIGLLLPWMAYQKWYEPPGDRLTKWHLAGIGLRDEDIDEGPFRDALVRAYRSKTPEELAEARLLNLGALFWDMPAENETRFGDDFDPNQELTVMLRFRDAQMHHLIPALLLLNLGWIPLLRRLRRDRDPEAGLERLFFGVAVSSTLVWILLMFNAGTTVLHHGSYADILLLMTLLSVALCRGEVLHVVVLVPHMLLFLFVWIFTTPCCVACIFNPYLLPLSLTSFVLVLGVTLGAWDLRLVRWLRHRGLCGLTLVPNIRSQDRTGRSEAPALNGKAHGSRSVPVAVGALASGRREERDKLEAR